MWDRIKLRPILLSALVLVYMHETLGVELSTLCNDYVDITVPGYKSGTNPAKDFPLLVRISEARIEGFKYTRTLENGSDLRFVFSAPELGEQNSKVVTYDAPCRVEEWNTNGESRVYVAMPWLNNNDKLKLSMYWAADNPNALPANNPSKVPDPKDTTGRKDFEINALKDQATNENYIAFSNFHTTGNAVYEEKERVYAEAGMRRTTATPRDFAYTSTFKVDGYTGGGVVSNFPFKVSLRTSSPEGFKYSSLPSGGTTAEEVYNDIRFYLPNGAPLDYEIDTWDSAGTSVIWVKLPELKAAVEFLMCWGARVGTVLPNNEPTSLWREYAGVWHLSELVTAENAATTYAHDSTTNHLEAVPFTKSGDLSRMVSVAGRVGRARINDTTDSEEGNCFKIADFDQLKLGDTFALSAWVRCDGYAQTGSPQIFSYRKGFEGWAVSIDESSRNMIDVVSGGFEPVKTTVSSMTLANIGFQHYTFAFAGSELKVYINGNLKSTKAIASVGEVEGITDLIVGNGFSDGEHMIQNFRGAFDEIRVKRGTVKPELLATEYKQMVEDSLATGSSVVFNDSIKVQNRWLEYPSLSKTEWAPGESAATVFSGRAMGGRPTVYFEERTTGVIFTSMPIDTIGEYRAVFSCPETKGWSALTYTINFRIAKRGGDVKYGTLEERVLLANDDESKSACKIYYQGYDVTDDSWGGNFWQHTEGGLDASTGEDYTSTSARYNLFGGVDHVYWGEHNTKLWELYDIRFGNTFVNAEVEPGQYGTEGLKAEQNYLPWNPNSQSMVSWDFFPVGEFRTRAGMFLMRNTTNAEIRSGEFLDGIGTIYFDAVNGWNNNLYNEAGESNYRIAVEVSSTTNTDGSAKWEVATMHPIRFQGEKYERLTPTTELSLECADGGSITNFYRIYVPVDIMTGARFRIVRKSIDPAYSRDPDVGAFILVDNIIASKPGEKVAFEPTGWYDETKRGWQLLGQEGAFEPAFPGVGDEVLAKVKIVSSGANDLSSKVSAITMHYRWHYLDQAYTDWQYVDFNPTTLKSISALSLPEYAGDIDFWFEGVHSGNYWQYVDFSGANLGVPDYSEACGTVTNGWDGVKAKWSTRYRDGSSEYEGFNILVKENDYDSPKRVPMALVVGSTWRGYYRTISGTTPKEVKVRFEGVNPQAANSEWTWGTNYWYFTESAKETPVSGRLTRVTDDSNWTLVPVDATTGYLMFQLDSSSRGFTMIHADYQNFNDWNDAKKQLFSGASTEDGAKSGSSPDAQTFTRSYAKEADTPAGDRGWNVDFGSGIADERKFSVTNYNGWTIGEGRYVYGAYDDNRTGLALQMEPQGHGYVQMVNPLTQPRGIESVALNARISQEVDFNAVSYLDGALRMTNYTFMARCAFDSNLNQDFTGNGSVSLFAYYRAGVGGYEARWEQISAVIKDNKSAGPLENGQRLSIYKWYKDGSGIMRSKRLYSQDNAGYFGYKIPKSTSVTNGLMPLVISAYNEGNKTVIVAGIKKRDNGVTAGQTISSSSDTDWGFIISYDEDGRNGTGPRHKSGSYGVLTTSCPGALVHPQIANEKIKIVSITINPKDDRCNNVAIDFTKVKFANCYQDIVDNWWVVGSQRMSAFYDAKRENAYYGFKARTPTQNLNLMTRTAGSKEDWQKRETIQLEGFGRANIAADIIKRYYWKDDLELRLQAGNDINDDNENRIVIDDIVLKQWRGLDESKVAAGNASPDDFVYTQGWLTGGAVQLSARRSKAEYPCSIRTPIFDGFSGRGVGLGMLGFSYRNVQPNARLLLQIATNVTYRALSELTKTVEEKADGWQTVAIFNGSDLGAGGTTNCYLGLHGVTGVMRLIVDPKLIKELETSEDIANFGQLEIYNVVCKNEPPLDKGCWWGWNMRTLGDNEDSEYRMFLPDYTTLPAPGLSLALNNSSTADVDVGSAQKSEALYGKYDPFVQSPTFVSNIVGEVSFRARKYELSDLAPTAKLTLYGITTDKVGGIDDIANWEKIADFAISNSMFKTYSCKTDVSQNYCAFRFAVDGVAPAKPGVWPQRVVIDEVAVFEAIRAKLGFRNVGAFRNNLRSNEAVPNVPSRSEQPLCNEAFGIQAELYAVMLEDEIDKTHTPTVKLYWYEGMEPWGFDNWKNSAKAKNAMLSKVTGDQLIYRSSYEGSPEAVIPAVKTARTVVQYMLEVEYYTLDTRTGQSKKQTSLMSIPEGDWTRPEWYAPLDYNKEFGANRYYSGYTILDTVAPGWVWINEFNVFGGLDNYRNRDRNTEYVEIAAPAVIDLTGWRVQMLGVGVNKQVVTNVVATFGRNNLPSKKTDNLNMISNYVFHVIANPDTGASGTDRSILYDPGALDGLWTIRNLNVDLFRSDNTLEYSEFAGLMLVRPNGIVEHEVLSQGKDIWGGSTELDNPVTMTAFLNRTINPGRFFFAGDDNNGDENSVGVISSFGEGASNWTNNIARTPGKINIGQQINPNVPMPQGDTIVVYANLDQSGGPIRQTCGEGVNTPNSQILLVERGSEKGTNITYYVNPWYEVASVIETTEGASKSHEIPPKQREITVYGLGKGCSNNVSVVAKAGLDSGLKPYLREDDPYKTAVIDWLTGNETLQGTFAGNEIKLAKIRGISDKDKTYEQLTEYLGLTQMYWLDMDPTDGHLSFSGWSTKILPPSPPAQSNVEMSVFMMISNETAEATSPNYGKAWAPYVLRGREPGSLSSEYGSANMPIWSNVTFRVWGILDNGLTNTNTLENAVGLKWYVFNDDSFKSDFTADIEFPDPLTSTKSPGLEAGWLEWHKAHKDDGVIYGWSIDTILRTFPVNMLKPENPAD